MKIRMFNTWFVSGAVAALAVSLGGVLAFAPQPSSAAPKSFSAYVDGEGNISLPTGYRTQWAFLGAWFVPDQPKARGPGLHDVFTRERSVSAYLRDGSFPDATVLVKEIRKLESKKLTTGEASWGGDIDHWFVMVKDSKNRFPDNKHWAQGWGWALFYPKDPSVNASKGFRASCWSCHTPAQNTDWVFVQGYPTLRKAE